MAEEKKKKAKRRIVIEKAPVADITQQTQAKTLEEFLRDPIDDEVKRVMQRHSWTGKDKDLGLEVLHFERFGRLEYLIRSVSKDYEFWSMTEVQTGDFFHSYFTPTSAGLALVLDGDHVLSYDSEVVNVEKPSGTVVQTVEEMKEFIKGSRFMYGESEGMIMFASFPTPEKFSYTYSSAAAVFDVHAKVDRFVLFVRGNEKISVWKWVNEKGKEPRVEKEYIYEFKEETRDVIALPKQSRVGADEDPEGRAAQSDQIAVSLETSVVIFDITKRTELRKIRIVPMNAFQTLILPNGNLAIREIRAPYNTLIDVSGTLKGGTQYSEVDLASIRSLGRHTFMYESFEDSLIFADPNDGDELLLLTADEGKTYNLYQEGKTPGREVEVDGKVIKHGTMSAPLKRWEMDGFYNCLFHGFDLGLVQGAEFSFSPDEMERVKNPLPLHQAYPEYDVVIGGVKKSCRHNAPKGWSKAEMVAEVVRQNLQSEKKAKANTKDGLCYLLREEGKGNKPERKEEPPKGKTTITFVDARELTRRFEKAGGARSEEKDEGAKSKQTLDLFRGMTGNGMSLPGNRYLVELHFGSYQLIEYSTETGKYSLGPVLQLDILLPASTRQKKIMKNFLDEFFVEAEAPIPKEIADVVAGFI
jgi:hypothetical protein